MKEFYLNYGYGLICRGYQSLSNRILDPYSVASCRLHEDEYEHDLDESPYGYYAQNYLAFFQVSEVSYLAIKMDEPDPEGRGPIHYFSERIADSIEDFVNKMNKKCNYCIDFEDSD